MTSFRTMMSLAAVLGAIAGPAGAQISDTANAAGATTAPLPERDRSASPVADTTAGRSGDSVAARQRGDSGTTGNAGRPADSIADSASAPDPAAVSIPTPSDSVLASACAGASAGSIAPGLLTVVFTPDATEREREAAAREVGGLLAGTDAAGETYVRLEPEADPLSIVADRLIRQPPVMQVSVAGCPRVGLR
jgi:hypothetical protein